MLSWRSGLGGVAFRPCAKSRRRAGPALWVLALATLSSPSHADTVASLLGNFTINQFCGLELSEESIRVHYAVVFGQLPALSELHNADRNGDGVTSQSERDAYIQAKAPEFARHLKVLVDGVAVPLHLERSASSLPTATAASLLAPMLAPT